ncbi:MAG: hypothetical protein KAJ78_01510 [Acidobacteria bacterium]|nr:hypothetical protein [Acidobacteriota bacterium]
MRTVFLAVMILMTLVLPTQAVEFLGVELCTDRMSTTVVLPHGSPMTLESAEVGDQGALLLVLRSEDRQILDQIDDLMTDYTGVSGVGDEKSLQWSGRQITAFAQVLKKKLAVLAVSTSDDCREDAEVVPAAAEVASTVPSPEVKPTGIAEAGAGVEPAASAVLVPVGAVLAEPAADQAEAEVHEDTERLDFTLEGELRHEAFSDDWVDVMGVVVNNTADAYKIATFDLSLWDQTGRLICVDTISVSVLKSGQHRAFRDSIQCSGYTADAVARTELQFAGGH